MKTAECQVPILSCFSWFLVFLHGKFSLSILLFQVANSLGHLSQTEKNNILSRIVRGITDFIFGELNLLYVMEGHLIAYVCGD